MIMQPLRVDRNLVAEQSLPGEAGGHLGALERAACIADVKDRMISCLEELDRLQLGYAANHLCHAIEVIPDPPGSSRSST